MGAGGGRTVIGKVVKQPVGNVYVITTGPAETPSTIPEEDPTVAILALLLDHVPPDEQNNELVCATDTVVSPVIADGSGFTVISSVA